MTFTVRVVTAAYIVIGMFFAMTGDVTAQQERTQRLTVRLTTMAMMPLFEIPEITQPLPGMDLSALQSLFAPQREVRAEAVYPTKAVPPIYLTVPADLKLPRNRLVLEVPEHIEGFPGVGPGEEEGAPEVPWGTMRATTKLYWHPDTAKGPITREISVDMSRFTSPDLAPILAQSMAQFADEAARTASGSTTELPPNAVGAGQYTLNTGGSVSLDGFLPPIKMLSPTNMQELNPEKGLALRWEPVQGARGFIVHATGMSGLTPQDQTIITWVSTLKEPPDRVQSGYEPETTIEDDLRNGILLPPNTTSCNIPPDIFRGVDTFFVEVIAVGNDVYNQTNGLVVHGKIRSTWSASKMTGMLMGMPGLGGPGTEDLDLPLPEEDEP